MIEIRNVIGDRDQDTVLPEKSTTEHSPLLNGTPQRVYDAPMPSPDGGRNACLLFLRARLVQTWLSLRGLPIPASDIGHISLLLHLDP